jgi:hypothetical protein
MNNEQGTMNNERRGKRKVKKEKSLTLFTVHC